MKKMIEITLATEMNTTDSKNADRIRAAVNEYTRPYFKPTFFENMVGSLFQPTVESKIADIATENVIKIMLLDLAKKGLIDSEVLAKS